MGFVSFFSHMSAPPPTHAAAAADCVTRPPKKPPSPSSPTHTHARTHMAHTHQTPARQAEKEAAKLVERWSSPLFSHVTVEVDDDRVIPRWANVVFVAVVVGVFGYCAHFAYNNENRKAQVKEEARLEREMRARSAIDSGALRDHGRRNFASETETSDPFDGMSPEEIENLAARERAAAAGGVGGGGVNAGNGGGR